MSLIIIDDIIQTRDGKSRADLLKFLEEMSKDDEKYQNLKYICSEQRIGQLNPDFSNPIFFFNYETLDSARMKLQQNLQKINQLLNENSILRESQNSIDVNGIEQILYKQLYDEMQEKLSAKIVEYDQLQTQYSALENQQQEILKKSQNPIQGLCQQCLSGNQTLEKIKSDNLKLTQNLSNEQNKNHKLEKDLRDIEFQMQQLGIKHQNELDRVQNEQKMEYIKQLEKTQNMICRPCLNKQLQINDLENKIKNSEQLVSNKVLEADRRIKQKDDEVIELRKQLNLNKLINCQCPEKDSKIQQLYNRLEDLDHQLSVANKELEKLKKECYDVKCDLKNQNEKNVTLKNKMGDLLQDLKKQKEQQSEQQQVIKSANMEQQKLYEKLLQYEIQFQKMIQDKLETDKQLNQQLESLTSKDQPQIMSHLRKYISNQDRNLDQIAKDHSKFKEDFKLQMSLVTKQAIKSSIIIQQKRYQE